MKPLRPFSVNGETYLHPSRAAEMAGLNRHTLCKWAKAGFTSYGLELSVRREGKRLLIPEAKVRAIAELNRIYPLPRHGFLPQDQFENLKRAAHLYNISVLTGPNA
jgi:hypothetical protein